MTGLRVWGDLGGLRGFGFEVQGPGCWVGYEVYGWNWGLEILVLGFKVEGVELVWLQHLLNL